MEESLEDKIVIKVPVKISYSALEAYLREKLVGEKIGKEENGQGTNYISILDLFLAVSREEEFDLAVDVKFKTLTSLFHNKEGSILLDASIDFDAERQLLSVKKYRLQVDSKSWLLKKSFETLINSFFHKKIKKKMKYDFRPLIKEQLIEINKKLESSLEPVEGVFLSGFLDDFKVSDILPGGKMLLILVEIEGNALVDIKKISF